MADAKIILVISLQSHIKRYKFRGSSTNDWKEGSIIVARSHAKSDYYNDKDFPDGVNYTSQQ